MEDCYVYEINILKLNIIYLAVAIYTEIKSHVFYFY